MQKDILAEVTQPNVYVEVLRNCIPYYSPSVDVESNTFKEEISYKWIDNTEGLHYAKQNLM